MAENQKRPEATHRQRAAIGSAPEQFFGPDGRRYAFLSNSASDLIPTVQFGNVMVGPVTIARVVPVDPTPEEREQLGAEMEWIIETSRAQQKAAEAVAGSERRIIQWAIDPSSRVVNPTTGAEMAPSSQPASAQPAAASDPGFVPPPPAALMAPANGSPQPEQAPAAPATPSTFS